MNANELSRLPSYRYGWAVVPKGIILVGSELDELGMTEPLGTSINGVAKNRMSRGCGSAPLERCLFPQLPTAAFGGTGLACLRYAALGAVTDLALGCAGVVPELIPNWYG